MIVEEYMTPDPVTANPNDGLHQTYQRMRERGIRHMPVLDDAGHPIGIVSERDLRRPDFVDPHTNLSRPFILDNQSHVKQAMHESLVTVRPKDPLGRAVDLFIEHHVGALIVVDDQRRTVGILSVIDALRAFRAALDSRA